MTSTALDEPRLLKTDVLGRVGTPPERREALLDEFEKSGMSGAKFAAFIGVKYQTWANWVQKRRRARAGGAKAESGAPALRWMEAVFAGDGVSARSEAAGLKVQLPGGVCLEVADRRQARLAGELLRALQGEEPLTC